MSSDLMPCTVFFFGGGGGFIYFFGLFSYNLRFVIETIFTGSHFCGTMERPEFGVGIGAGLWELREMGDLDMEGLGWSCWCHGKEGHGTWDTGYGIRDTGYGIWDRGPLRG